MASQRTGLSIMKEKLGDCFTDIGNINYTDNARKLKTFQKITDTFCDNILVAAICNRGDTDKKKIIEDIINQSLYPSKLANYAVKKKLETPFSGKGRSIIRRRIRRMLKDNLEEYENSLIVLYKIELAEIDLKMLSPKLPSIMGILRSRVILIYNMDVTQDFAGIFNKEEIREHLQQSNTVIKIVNKKEVGIDCLMWNDHNARVKIYNKFICEITCPGVEKKLGNHIVDIIEQRDAHTKKTFGSPIAKKHGITRLEATIYNGFNSDSYQIENCLEVLENNLKYLDPRLFYSVPISKMWTTLADKLESSFCVVEKKTLLFAYWGNKTTNKITGVEINLPSKNDSNRQNIIDYALSAFSFRQLPVYYYEISDNRGPNQNLLCYKKKEGKTYFSRSPIGPSNGFDLTVISEKIQIEERGLVKTANIEPEVLRVPLSNIIPPYEIEQVETDIIMEMI